MNGEVQITDLVISKLLRQNIEKYRSLLPHVVAAIRKISGVIASRGDNIQYVLTDSNHVDPLQRITPARLISPENYDREISWNFYSTQQKQYYQYLDLIVHYLVLTERKIIIGGMRSISNVRKTSNRQRRSCRMGDPFPSESLIMALSYGTAINSSNN